MRLDVRGVITMLGEFTVNFGDTRGQTTVDFGIGVSIFLLTVIFVFLFIPSLFQPFVSDQSQAITADRTADRLAEDLLLPNETGADRYVLDRECTVEIFQIMNDDDDPATSPECRFDDGDAYEYPIHELLGLGANQKVNITIESADPNNRGVVELTDNTGEAYTLTTGDSTPRRGNVITAQRAIHITHPDGTDAEYRLFVRVW